MNKLYKIECYMYNGKFYEFTKTNLHTGFYCLRDCINSGLYNEIYFHVYEHDEKNKFLFNEKCFIPAGDGFIKSTTRANWYFERFKNWIDKYGTSKKIAFID